MARLKAFVYGFCLFQFIKHKLFQICPFRFIPSRKDLTDSKKGSIIQIFSKSRIVFSKCKNLLAHDLYVLGCPAREERRCGGDWRASPFVL